MSEQQPSLFNLEGLGQGYENLQIALDAIPVTDTVAPAAMVDNLRQIGMLSPVILQSDGEDNYTVVAGARRLAAARQIVKRMDKQEAADKRLNPVYAVILPPEADAGLVTLVENYIRDENPGRDFAAAFAIMQRPGATLEAVAKGTGIPLNRVKRLSRFTGLIPELREAFCKGKLKPGPATTLAKWPADRQEKALATLKAEGKVTGDHLKAIVNVSNGKTQANLSGMNPPPPLTGTPPLNADQTTKIREVAASLRNAVPEVLEKPTLHLWADQLEEALKCSETS